MEEDFEQENTEDLKISVERYEQMIRNKDQYFFDSQAFENIIEYYIEKNDPIKALQVADYAMSQHSFAAIFLIKKSQLLLAVNHLESALEMLERAELLEPSNPDIYTIKGSILDKFERHPEAIEAYQTALLYTSEPDEVYLQLAYIYENLNDYPAAIEQLKLCLQQNMEHQDALYELAFCFDIF